MTYNVIYWIKFLCGTLKQSSKPRVKERKYAWRAESTLYRKGKGVTADFDKIVIWRFGGPFEGTLILELECSD
jgi:hypothetical protein